MQNDEYDVRREMLPTAAIFDMDGVLVDTEPLHGEAFINAFNEYGLNLTIQDYRRMVTLSGINTKTLYLSLGGNLCEWDSVIETKHQIFKSMLEQKGYLLPGVIELLRSLHNAKIPTAIATSARRRSLDIITNQFNLQQYFDKTISYEDVQADKPNPDAYLFAAEQLNVEPFGCVVFEDSPRGVLAAHRAGMKCIAIPNSSTADGDFSLATVVVKSLKDVSLKAISGLFC